MKMLGPLFAALCAMADTGTPAQSFERAISRYENDACEAAKAAAKARFEIVTMNPDCRCERTDSREWQCDIGFTYRPENADAADR